MREVTRWLEDLGLGQYASVFAENDIDPRALPHLTDQDLKGLGVSLGHRRIVLAAIARLGDQAPPDLEGRTAAPRPRTGAAERRQLTVMFCDIVGSTALSQRLDPEDLRDLLRAYQETCANVVARFEGHVAKFTGDGMVIYFGYPQAHEDDAGRAVNAGLGILQGIKELNRDLADRYGVRLGVRVGVHTGLVVAGEMGGGQTLESDAIVGETPNIAARLQGLAEPDSVVISAATQRLVEGLFECDDLGPHRLKGVSAPVTVFRVSGRSDAPSHFEAVARRGLTSLIGRKPEIDLLLARWDLAKAGEAQVVVLSGEAGIGKSRIVRTIHERVESEPHCRILYYCSPYHRNSALRPAIEQLEQALGFAASDGVDAKLTRLESFLTGLGLAVGQLAPLLASLLSLPADGRYPTIEASPQLLRRKTLEALLSVIEALARTEPVLMVAEDVHWADPSTLELLGLAIERLRSARVLLIVNCRPEFQSHWSGYARATLLRLNHLSRKESEALVVEVARGKTLPEKVFQQIVDRTDGVPLFVEELTKAVLESDLLIEEEDRYVLRGPMAPFAIPASLHDSLMARLDRLAPVKEVAQVAATLGRTFSREVLAAVSPMEDRALEGALLQLEAAELIYRRGVAPDVTYDFKHALVQDAAYQSLLKRDRQQHHARIARVLEERFPAVAANEPELLAHHYTEAGLAEPAVDYWQKAAQRAMQRSANAEAEGHLRRGIAVLETAPAGPERRRREILLHNTLGVCLMPTRGFGNPEVAEAFSRAAAISEEEGDSRGLFVALRGKGQYQMISGGLRTAHDQLDRILTLARELADPGLVIEAHHLGWSTLTFTGELASARRHAEIGMALYDRQRDHGLTYVYSGHDPGVCCRSFGSLALWQLGYPDQALAACRDGERLARELAHPFSVTIALWALGMMHLLRREPDATRQTGEAMIAHSSEKGFPPFVPMGKIFRGGALAEMGELDAGIRELVDGIAGVRVSGTSYTLPLFFAWLAEICGKAGRIAEGLDALEQGLALSSRTEDQFSLPDFYRIKGELRLAGSADTKAEAQSCFERAIELARAQEAKSLELRATTRLARLWGETHRRSAAHDLLAPVYHWFSEGFDTLDLKDAKALLGELA